MIRPLLALGAWPALAAINLVSLEPTVLFPRATPLRQVAFVTLVNDQASPNSCEISAGDGPVAKATAGPGVSKHRVLVDDLAAPVELTFTVRCAGQAPVVAKRTWHPQRKWKVHLIKSSHEDLGYENYIFKKQKEVADFIDLARDQAGNMENRSDQERQYDARFHYTMESLVFLRNYVEQRGLQAWRRVVEEDVKTGRIHLAGAPSGLHSHWMDYEELARVSYPARREAKDRWGLDLKTFMIVDNPSLSWSGAQALADAGYKYVARWGQGWRTGGNNNYQTTKLPALFWWKAPNGHHRILFGWRSSYGNGFWYGQTAMGNRNRLGDLPAEAVNAQLLDIQNGSLLGPYPFDAVVEPGYIDHDLPRVDTRVLPAWTEKYAYPEIRFSGPDQFFEYIEAKYGAQLPVLSGDLNNFSADYATIDPDSQGWKRRAARLLPFAESLGALATAFQPSFLLHPGVVDRTYARMFDYDEHSWPTLPPESDVQLFNANWIKKQEAARALAWTKKQFQEASSALARNISTGAEETIAVFNPLAHQRSGLVTVAKEVRALVDSVTGKKVMLQEGSFLAENVPALGYKLYRVAPGPLDIVTISAEDRIENEYYAVRFDEQGVRSIVEKSSGRELLDPQAEHRANQTLFVNTATREDKKLTIYVPGKPHRTQTISGPTSVTRKTWISDTKTGAAIIQSVTLPRGVKRVDFVNELQHVRALHTDQYAERYAANVFFAFPLAVEQGQFRGEYPGGVVRPYDDQLRWGTHDYLQVNRWLDVSNARHGITLAPWSQATFHLGEIRYNQFSIDYKPTKSHVYAYAWSNRMAGLLTLGPDDMNATIGYSLTSHDGDWNSGATTQFGWETASPLEAVKLPRNQSGPWREAAKSFLSVDAPNVQLTVLKPSEQPGRGFIVRLVETEGRETEFSLNASLPGIQRVFLCDLVENDRQELPRGAKWKIRPFDFLTLRFETATRKEAIQVSAKGVSDSAIQLAWTGGTAPAYDIFRSVDPADPPVAQNLVARVTGATFIDKGLHYQTKYTYHVVPVYSGNQHGAPAKTQAETVGRNITAPAVVAELGVVRRSPQKLMIYWRSNTEPDVSRYYLYRGTQPDFPITGQKALAVIQPEREHFLQLHVDEGLQAGVTYYYKVVAEDFAGNRQSQSPVASATTPR